jgi:hypothetical protein
MHQSRVNNLFALAAIVVGILVGCMTSGDKEAKRGSEIGNELGVGMIFLADGTPAADARVRLYSVDHVPQPTVSPKVAALSFETRTDAKGRYELDSLTKGEYNILADLDGTVAYSDSVFISGSNPALPKDTLRVAGSVIGKVQLQPNHDPRAAIVQVLGTNFFANVDKFGGFRIEGLAEGSYSIRVVVTLPDYTPLRSGFHIFSGREDTLPQPLRPDYTFIPVVVGLSAAYDTLHGIATLRWHPADYRFLESYTVYRRQASTIQDLETPVGNITDTVFEDSLFSDSAWDLPLGEKSYVYSVRIKNLSGQMGLRFGSASVKVVPPYQVITTSQLFSAQGDSIGIFDSLRIDLKYGNPGRIIRKIDWFVDGDSAVRTKTDASKEGSDFLKYAWSIPGNKTVRVAITDDGGHVIEEQLEINILQDDPVADAGGSINTGVQTSIHLQGKAQDGFGSIKKWEWDIGGKGKFLEFSNGETTIQAPTKPQSEYLCILRVTDNHALTGLDTLRINVVLDAPMAYAGEDLIVGVGDSIHLAGRGTDVFGSISKLEWDIGAKGKFLTVKTGDTTFSAPLAPDSAYQCVLRVTDNIGNQSLDTIQVWVGPWHVRKSLPFDPVLTAAVGENILILSEVEKFEEWRATDNQYYSAKGPLSAAVIWQKVGKSILSVPVGSREKELWNAVNHEWDGYGFQNIENNASPQS